MTKVTPLENTPLITPVLFIIFNRPDTTRKVFEAIRLARPTRLYIAADGPRLDRIGEAEKCKEARAITDSIDWDCKVERHYQERNLGCGKGPDTAITWFFKHEPEGIILEDDCLPSPSFFTFCSELLVRYRDDTRVMEIGGTNLEPVQGRDEEFSYRFSNMVYIWGWATWRRAWCLQDFHMTRYKEISEKGYLDESYPTIFERDFNNYVFNKMHNGDERTNSSTIWDYQWQFACKINSGLVVVPNRNLIQNLGFGAHGTNTINPTGVGYDLTLETMSFPMRHPEFMMVNQERDNAVFDSVCTTPTSKMKSRIKNLLPEKVLKNVVKPLMNFFSF